MFKFSKYQMNFFEWMVNGTGNCVLEAVAGSGKTTTIVSALNLTCVTQEDLKQYNNDIEELVKNSARISYNRRNTKKVLFCAFNKHIEEELSKRAPSYVTVSTLHAIGKNAIQKHFLNGKGNIWIDAEKLGALMQEYWPIEKGMKCEVLNALFLRRNIAKKLVTLCKSTLADYNNREEIEAFVDKYNVTLIEGVNDDENEDRVLDEVFNILPSLIEKSLKINGKCRIDFDDMIYWTIKHNIPMPKYDWVFIDEAQDLNQAQIQMALRCVTDVGRIVCVGDRRQSIYGFRFADFEAIPNIIKQIDATVLPLSITYRCPKEVVNTAKQIVSNIEASETAKDGLVTSISDKEVASIMNSGDMCLCRTNAPLIDLAFVLISQGKKAVVRGRDIGKQLLEMIEKIGGKGQNDLNVFIEKLTEYKTKNEEKLLKAHKEKALQALQDKCECLYVLINNVDTLEELKSSISTIFSDDIIGIVLSSVHKAKGLEAERVFILKPQLMPHPRASSEWEMIQEYNILYVAITRAMNELFFVLDEKSNSFDYNNLMRDNNDVDNFFEVTNVTEEDITLEPTTITPQTTKKLNVIKF